MNVDFNVDAALQQIGSFVQQHGPQAIDAMAAVVQVTAIGNLIFGGFCVLVGTICALCARSFFKKADDSGLSYHVSEAYMWALIATCILAVLSFFVSLFFVLDVWNWAALWNPRLALMHAIWQGIQDTAHAAAIR